MANWINTGVISPLGAPGSGSSGFAAFQDAAAVAP